MSTRIAAGSAAAAELVEFWREAGLERWFGGGAAFDAECQARFGELHFAAARRDCDGWLHAPDGALALVLLLDQIPRNIFRGTAHSYATDSLARERARQAIAAGHDQAFEPLLRCFFYLPYQHSEDLADQERAVALTRTLDHASYLEHAKAHRDVIARFGRFPHRNAALGRATSPEEQDWLDAGGGFG